MTMTPSPPILGLDLLDNSITAAFPKEGVVRILLLSGRPFYGLSELSDTTAAFAMVLRVLADEGVANLECTTLSVPLHWSQARWQILSHSAQRAGMGAVRIVTTPVAHALSRLHWQKSYGDHLLAIFDIRSDRVGWGVFQQEEELTQTLSLHYRQGKDAFTEELQAHRFTLIPLAHISLLARMGEIDQWEPLARQAIGVCVARFMTMLGGGSAYLSASGALVQSAILVGRIKNRMILEVASYSYRLAVAQELEWPICPDCGPQETITQTNCAYCGKETESKTVMVPGGRSQEPCRWEYLITPETTIPTRKSCTILVTPGAKQAVVEGVDMDGQVFVRRVIPVQGHCTCLLDLTLEVAVGHEQRLSFAFHGQTTQIYLPIFPEVESDRPLDSVLFPHPDLQIYRDTFFDFFESPEVDCQPKREILTADEIDDLIKGLEDASIDLDDVFKDH